jgi:hypothetical protein
VPFSVPVLILMVVSPSIRKVYLISAEFNSYDAVAFLKA